MKKIVIALVFCGLFSSMVVASPTVTVERTPVGFREACPGLYILGKGVYRVGKGIYYLGKLIVPKRYEVTIYTTDGKLIKFIRYSGSAFALKKRLKFNAATGGCLNVWRTKDDEGLTLRIPSNKIQNISIVRAPKARKGTEPTPAEQVEYLNKTFCCH